MDRDFARERQNADEIETAEIFWSSLANCLMKFSAPSVSQQMRIHAELTMWHAEAPLRTAQKKLFFTIKPVQIHPWLPKPEQANNLLHNAQSFFIVL